MPKFDWFWFLAGIGFALFLLPMLKGMIGGIGRPKPSTTQRTM